MQIQPCLVALALGLLGTSAPAEDGPLALFNGENLDGFETWLRGNKHADPDAVFSVVDGAIRISGEGFGYLATQKRFRDYHLKLEYCWGDQEGIDRAERTGKALDSGVFLHAGGPHGNSHDGKGAYMAAIECNIFEGATGDILLIRGTAEDGSEIAPRVVAKSAPKRDRDGFPFWSKDGAPVALERWGRVNWFGKASGWIDVRGFRGRRDVEKRCGQWNSLECRCDRDEITIILNGILVNKVSKISPQEGKILLQCEGAEIYFRNLTLRKLSEPNDGAADSRSDTPRRDHQ